MRRRAIKDFFGTVLAFVILCALTFGVIYAEFLLDLLKAHKAGGG